MLAIPSPDVVVNLFASLGQLLAVLSLLLGGAAISRRGKAGGKTSRRLLYVVFSMALASWIGFGLYYAKVQDERNLRLRANLTRASTEAGKNVGDTSLKTLSFSGQLKHPLGMATGAVRTALSKSSLNLIDIREKEETERGRLPGSWSRRYPDLRRDRSKLIAEGKTTVLLCYSGNRSSELAEEFAKDGLDCRFMVGGYEKWIAEDGALEGQRSGAALRELPTVPGGDVLLDTAEAIDAVNERKAVFVDVRYPEDFARGHLPGAINLPIRKLTSVELEKRLQALPNQPIIAPCYDKRSSFYASILAVRLHRRGGEFLGRYTVPHEFPSSSSARSHVVAWQSRQAASTLFGYVERGLLSALLFLRDLCGGLGVGILLLVLIIRGALSPLTFKADLDQWRQRFLTPKIRALREQHASDPHRGQRAVLEQYRKAGLTPGRNLMVSIGQLLLFLAFFAVVRRAAKGTDEIFLLWHLDSPDPTHILPFCVGLLMAALVWVGKVSRTKATLSVLLGVLLTALTWQISAAGNIYLVASLAWVVVQGRIARARASAQESARHGARASHQPATDVSAHGVVTFKQAAFAQGAGNKAIRLGQMQQAGLPVADGFAITDSALFSGNGTMDSTHTKRIQQLHRRLCRKMRTNEVAVRSSGLNEDGGDRSYAGVFESILNVPREKLDGAIQEVRSSMDTERARAYGEGDERGGIVVQAMVQAEYAGVLFTEHPGCSGTVLVEMVEGLCEQLVSGEVTPESYGFTRVSGKPTGDKAAPINLAPLLKLGRSVESHFGKPQDIEWAYARGKFYLLQSRDVTVRSGSGSSTEALLQRERARILHLALGASEEIDKDDVLLVQNELAELLPDPSPFSLAFMSSLWSAGGSVDLACRSLGVGYAISEDHDYIVSVFGKLFVNRIEEKGRLAKGLGGMASFRLTRMADGVEQDFRDTFLPEFHSRMRLYEVADLSQLTDEDLFEAWRSVRTSFVTTTYVEAERINIIADFFAKSASDQLKRQGHNPTTVLSHAPETVVHNAFELLAHGQVDKFSQIFGHRAPHDFEFKEPRYAENSALVAKLSQAPSPTGKKTSQAPAATKQPVLGRVTQVAVDRARTFQTLKEEAKHEAMRELAVLRSLTKEIGRRHGIENDIFWLEPDEVAALDGEPFDQDQVQRQIRERQELAEIFEQVELPTKLTLHELETLQFGQGPLITRVHDGEAITGLRVAGETEVVGTVRVVRSVEQVEEFRSGEILVARFTDPQWSTVFPIAGGLVTEVGGWLSHAAIQAREYGLACIVDVPDACNRLQTGQLVRLQMDGSVVPIDSASDPTGQGASAPTGSPSKVT